MPARDFSVLIPFGNERRNFMCTSINSMTLQSVKPLAEHKLLLSFTNGEKKVFDVKPYITGSWMGELQDETYFRQVRIHPLLKDTVMWPDEQDISPHELYQLSIPYCE